MLKVSNVMGQPHRVDCFTFHMLKIFRQMAKRDTQFYERKVCFI